MRLATIDTLRGLAIFAMILIHSTAYFLSGKAVFFLWNYSQFAVPIFFFCSSYLLFSKDPLPHWKHIFPYFKKRLSRLLLPFYIYLAAYFLLIGIFEPHRLNPEFLIRNITMTTLTPEANWIVILFLVFAFINPLLSYTYTHKKIFFYIYCFLAMASSIYLLFLNFPWNFKLIMWLPWSLIVIFGFYFVKNERKRWFYKTTLVWAFLLFMAVFGLQILLNHSLSFHENKYPPNLFYISYGFFSVTAIYYVVQKEVLKILPLEKFLHFLSIHSYSLFFVHFLVIYVISQTVDYVKLGWWGFFIVVMGISLILQKLILRFNAVMHVKVVKQPGI